ncbi:type II toxin-antitoxin system CcdA family antitoxin [Photorhabdus stackebrandtii]|uniref:Uncharacterized protein n=1 Tax=Photorhabdus stackebrandtii TaxID=1123042 RepID=A0A7X5QJT6_9GAMM|nr:hypothetical protein [Photorhabdus stackebrandtii]
MPDHAVQRFDGVGGVDHLADVESIKTDIHNYNSYTCTLHVYSIPEINHDSKTTEALNRFHDEQGCFSDEYRTF